MHERELSIGCFYHSCVAILVKNCQDTDRYKNSNNSEYGCTYPFNISPGEEVRFQFHAFGPRRVGDVTTWAFPTFVLSSLRLYKISLAFNALPTASHTFFDRIKPSTTLVWTSWDWLFCTPTIPHDLRVVTEWKFTINSTPITYLNKFHFVIARPLEVFNRVWSVTQIPFFIKHDLWARPSLEGHVF